MLLIDLKNITILLIILFVSYIIFLFLPASLTDLKIDKKTEKKLEEELKENLKE